MKSNKYEIYKGQDQCEVKYSTLLKLKLWTLTKIKQNNTEYLGISVYIIPMFD